MCDLDPKVEVIGKKAGIYDGVPSTAALVYFIFRKVYICKNSLDPDQTRMEFRKMLHQFKICACDRKYAKSVNTVECPNLSYKS